MARQSLEENKGRWMLFEQVSPISSAFYWAVVAIIVALVAWYALA